MAPEMLRSHGHEKPDVIVIVDTSRIRAGKLADVKAAMAELAAFAKVNEPCTVAYEVYLDNTGEHVTVLQIHRDAASAEFHMSVAAPAFEPFADLLALQRIDVYGAPSDALLGQLRSKAHPSAMRLWRSMRCMPASHVSAPSKARLQSAHDPASSGPAAARGLDRRRRPHPRRALWRCACPGAP